MTENCHFQLFFAFFRYLELEMGYCYLGFPTLISRPKKVGKVSWKLSVWLGFLIFVAIFNALNEITPSSFSVLKINKKSNAHGKFDNFSNFPTLVLGH